MVDYCSRFFEMEFTKSTTSERIVSRLSKIFVTHGLPLSHRTDNGSQFVSDYFKKYLEENGIEHWPTTALWPQANSGIDRQNRSILKRPSIAQAEGRKWRSEMDVFLIMYRGTPHFTDGFSPGAVAWKKHQDQTTPTARVHSRRWSQRPWQRRKEKGKVYVDYQRNAHESKIEGDKVLLNQEKENKLSTTYEQSPL